MKTEMHQKTSLITEAGHHVVISVYNCFENRHGFFADAIGPKKLKEFLIISAI